MMVTKKNAIFVHQKEGLHAPPKIKTTTAFWMVEKFSPEKLPPSPAVVNPFTKVDRSCPFFWTQTLSVSSLLENDRSCPQLRERAEILVKSQNRLGKNNGTFSLFNVPMWKKNNCLSVFLGGFSPPTPKPKKLSFFRFSVLEVRTQRNTHTKGARCFCAKEALAHPKSGRL